MFQRAVKYDAKLRLALCGPAGSGKTYSLLSIATEMGGPIAYVDTEHGSASKYADLFAFDVIEPAVFDPRELIKTIKAAVEGGYRVVCIDSLSHYWMGKGGELEMVDTAAARSKSGNSFAAWKNVTPVHNELVDTIIGAQIHVLVAMRTKTEWVIEKDTQGRQVPRKIGLQPVMRDGIEFEFDVCGDLDQENTLTVTKSRCPELSGKVINRPGKEMALVLKRWLSSAPAPAPAPGLTPAPAQAAAPVPVALPENGAAKEPYQATDDDLPAEMGGTWQDPNPGPSAAAHVAEMKQRLADQPPTVGTPQAHAPTKPWTTFKGMIAKFADLRSTLANDALYYGELDLFRVRHANEFKSTADALACYRKLVERASAIQSGAREAVV